MLELTTQSLATPRKRRRPLKTAADVRRELCRLYFEMREGEIEPALGGKLTFVLMSIVRVHEVSEIEARLQALEAEAEQP